MEVLFVGALIFFGIVALVNSLGNSFEQGYDEPIVIVQRKDRTRGIGCGMFFLGLCFGIISLIIVLMPRL